MNLRLQLIIYFVLFLLVIIITMSLVQYYCYQKIYLFDCYTGFKNEILDSLITTQQKHKVNLEYIDLFNQIDQKNNPNIFYKILSKELIKHKILNINSFNYISNYTETFFNKSNTENLSFDLREEDSKKYFDKNPSNLKALSILFYLYFPLIIDINKNLEDEILSGYVLSYKFKKENFDNGNNADANNDTNNYTNNYTISDFQYFNFPVENKFYSKNQNFIQNNPKTDPYILDKYQKHNISFNLSNNYSTDNWYYKIDDDYRKSILNNNFHSKITYLSYSLFRQDELNVYLLSSFEYLVKDEYNNESIIISIIIRNQNSFSNSNDIQSSVFLIESKETQTPLWKYSDNYSYVISRDNITTMHISDILCNYFYYGSKREDFLFNYGGVNFDTFDINNFRTQDEIYNFDVFFRENLGIFSSIYFYISSIQSKNQNQYFIENEPYLYLLTDLLINFTDSESINNVCSKLNYSKLFENIERYKLSDSTDCLSNNQLYDYKESKNMTFIQPPFRNFPKCKCIPFYCLNISTSEIRKNKIFFSNSVEIPGECSLKIDSYYNPYDSYSKTILNKYIKYNWLYTGYFQEYSIGIATMIDDEFYYNINIIFLKDSTHLIKTLIIIYASYTTFAGIIMTIFLSFRIKKLTMVISEYIVKHEYFLFRIGDSNKKNSKEHDSIGNNASNNNIGNINLNLKNELNINSQNDIEIIDEENANLNKHQDKKLDHYYNDNSLIDDLFIIYCKYYSIDPDECLNNLDKENKETNINSKILIMKRQNELFDILCLLSQNAARYRFNYTIYINLYANSKLNQQYQKGLAKCNNFDKNQADYTQFILFEMISTENIEDFGVVLNLSFNFLDYNNEHSRIKNRELSSIKKSYLKYTNGNESKIIGKINDEAILYFLENHETDDYNHIQSAFDFELINVFSKYYNLIIDEKYNYN